MASKKLSFEQSITRLEKIVKHLENGDMPLNDSLSLFEEATGLISACTDMLDNAEQKVVKLKKGPDRAPIELPFDEDIQS